MVPLPLLVIGLGGSVMTIGLLGAVMSSFYACGCFIAAPLLRFLPAKGLAIAGAAVAGSAYVLLARAQTVADVFQAVALSAAAWSIFWVSMETWLGEQGNARGLQRRAVALNVSWSMGLIIGPWFGGMLFDWKLTAPFYAAAAALFCCTALVMVTLPVKSKHDSAGRNAAATRNGSDLEAGERLFKVLRTAQFAHWLMVATILVVWPKLAVDEGFTATEIGSFFAMFGIVQTVTFTLMGLVHVWRFRRFILYFAQIVAAVAAAVIALVFERRVLFVAFGILGAVTAFVHTSSLYYSLFQADKRGLRASLHKRLAGSGSTVGPLYGGALARVFSRMWLPFVLMPVLFLCAIAAEEKLFRRASRPG